MKFIFSIIAILILAFLFQWLLPWWSAALAGFVGAFFINQKNGLISFFGGFIAISLLWGLTAYMINAGNDGMLASRLAELFQLSGPGKLVILTALIGGLLGGFGACTGDLGKQLVSGNS